jgi:hypothetical protein
LLFDALFGIGRDPETLDDEDRRRWDYALEFLRFNRRVALAMILESIPAARPLLEGVFLEATQHELDDLVLWQRIGSGDFVVTPQRLMAPRYTFAASLGGLKVSGLREAGPRGLLPPDRR